MEIKISTSLKTLVLFSMLFACGFLFSASKIEGSSSNVDLKNRLEIEGGNKTNSSLSVNTNLTQVTATCANNGSIATLSKGTTSSPGLYLFKNYKRPTNNDQIYPFHE